MLEDLESYLAQANSPTEIVHWFNTNYIEPGLFHLFYDGDLYIMATYDGNEFLEMEIDEVLIEENRITVTAKGGESILKDGTADEVDSYASNVFVIRDVAPAL